MDSLKNAAAGSILRRIRDGERSKYAGICYAYRVIVDKETTPNTRYWLKQAFGYLNISLPFPVPHPGIDPLIAYERSSDKWVGEYGANRLYLLSLLIKLADGELVPPFER